MSGPWFVSMPALVIGAWLLYLAVKVAEHVDAWPF